MQRLLLNPVLYLYGKQIQVRLLAVSLILFIFGLVEMISFGESSNPSYILGLLFFPGLISFLAGFGLLSFTLLNAQRRYNRYLYGDGKEQEDNDEDLENVDTTIPKKKNGFLYRRRKNLVGSTMVLVFLGLPFALDGYRNGSSIELVIGLVIFGAGWILGMLVLFRESKSSQNSF